MRLALAQVDPTVGDFDGNVRLVLERVREAEDAGAHLVMLPELVVTGYPPEDLLAREDFVERNLEALKVIAAEASIPSIVGFVDRQDGTLFNAAAFCEGGVVRAVYRKRRLPNYGVFDEKRYFEAGTVPLVLDSGGRAVAPTVCEDIWVPEIIEEVAGLGAQLVVNISASPFHAGKGCEREAMLVERARTNGVWVAYCNLVGAQDELVFDGRSVVISPSGEVVARAASFAEDLLFYDIPGGTVAPAGEIAPMADSEEETYAALVLGLRDYLAKNGFTDAVVGLSGGIDSALTATLAADAVGADHVHGVLMPSRYSSEGSLTDAAALAANLGIEAIELPIESTFQATLDTLSPVFRDLPADVTEENLQARVRGMLLMALSNKFGWLVLATGNKSELSVGYSTLYGDMVGGFAPIKDVFKTRVYDLARWRNRDSEVIPQASLTKAPSAELRPDQTDQDSLPAYEVLDGILHLYVERDRSADEIAGEGYDANVVTRVVRMVDSAEYKRRQGPMGIKITPKAFGKDRRVPVTNRFVAR